MFLERMELLVGMFLFFAYVVILVPLYDSLGSKWMFFVERSAESGFSKLVGRLRTEMYGFWLVRKGRISSLIRGFKLGVVASWCINLRRRVYSTIFEVRSSVVPAKLWLSLILA